MKLDVLEDSPGDIHGLLPVLYLGAHLGRADIILKRVDDPDVVLVLAEGLHGGLDVGLMGPLDDEGAVVAEEDVNVGGGPYLGVAHGEGEVGADEEHDARLDKRAVAADCLDAAEISIDFIVKVPQDVGGAAVQGTARGVDARGLPVVDLHGRGGVFDGEAAHFETVVGGDEGGFVVCVAGQLLVL